MKINCLSLLTLAAAMTLPRTAHAVPQVINYQGKITQPSGAAIPDGTYSVAFSIYAAPTGGSSLWTETYPSLQVKGSQFHVLLGNINPVGSAIFNGSDRYLGVKVASDPEMTPRQRVASVPYALFAEAVPVSGLTGTIGTAQIADGSVTPPKLSATAWTAYTPAWTAADPDNPPAIGNGHIGGKYMRLGKTVFYNIFLNMGTTTTYGLGTWHLSLPSAANGNDNGPVGSYNILGDSGTHTHGGGIQLSGPTTIEMWSPDGSGITLRSNYPFSWGGGNDFLALSGFYEEE